MFSVHVHCMAAGGFSRSHSRTSLFDTMSTTSDISESAAVFPPAVMRVPRAFVAPLLPRCDMHPPSHTALSLQEISKYRLMGLCKCVPLPDSLRQLVSVVDLDENPHTFSGLLYRSSSCARREQSFAASAAAEPRRAEAETPLTNEAATPGLLERMFHGEKPLRVRTQSPFRNRVKKKKKNQLNEAKRKEDERPCVCMYVCSRESVCV